MLLGVKIENLNLPKWKCVSLEKHVFLPSDLFAQNVRHIGVPDGKPSPIKLCDFLNIFPKQWTPQR